MIEWSLLLSFATWRVTSLLYVESPFGWLRKWLGVHDDEETGARSVPDNLAGELWSCFWCLSLVVAFVMTTITLAFVKMTLFEAFIIWLVSAAGALVLDVRYFARLRG